MNIEASKWVCGLVLAIGGCDPHGNDDDGDSDESTAGEGPATSATSSYEEGGVTTDASQSSTNATTVATGDTEGCSDSAHDDEGGTVSATVTSATSYGSDDGGGESGGSAAEQCGVELEYGDNDSVFMCGCVGCNVQYDGLTEDSANALLNACECICEAVGCGISVTGGVTTGENGEDGEGTASGTGESGWGGESEGGTSTSTSSYEDG